jgi:hypothetical protein
MFRSYPLQRSLAALATVHHAAASGLTGWQVALIGIGVPLAAVVATILVRLARGRRASSPTG